jgi:hypothetical protein
MGLLRLVSVATGPQAGGGTANLSSTTAFTTIAFRSVCKYCGPYDYLKTSPLVI